MAPAAGFDQACRPSAYKARRFANPVSSSVAAVNRRRSAIWARRRNASWDRTAAASSVTPARVTARADKGTRLLTNSTPSPAAVAIADKSRDVTRVSGCVSRAVDPSGSAAKSTYTAIRTTPMVHAPSRGDPTA